MKAITLHQPHAHLISLGVKQYETRSWPTKHRGLIAIHAAKIQNTELDGIVIDPNARKPRYRKPYDRYLPRDWNHYFGNLNHGGIECLAVVRFCKDAPTVARDLREAIRFHGRSVRACKLTDALAFGDFAPGRYAWLLEVRLIVAGNVCGVVRGKQGIWNLPADVERTLLKEYEKATGSQICKVCGCTEEDACETLTGPCHWAADFLCTACRD